MEESSQPSKSRSRNRPFTEVERELLRELITTSTSVVDCKATGAVSNRRKFEAWMKITKKFNSSTVVENKATVSQLRKLWSNMKAKARDAITLEKQHNFTGGGPPPVSQHSAEADQIRAVTPQLMPTASVSQDSDTVVLEEICDNDETSWPRKRFRHETTEICEPVGTHIVASECEVQGAYVVTTADVHQSCDTQYAVLNEVQNAVINEVPSNTGIQSTPQTTLLTRSTRPITYPRGSQEPYETMTLDQLGIKLIYEDNLSRKQKNEEELRHIKFVNEMKDKSMMEEMEHNKIIHELQIEEMLYTGIQSNPRGSQEPYETMTLDQLRKKLIYEDILFRKQKNEEELRHIKLVNEMKEKSMMEEMEHNKIIHELQIEETQLKLAVLRRQLGIKNENQLEQCSDDGQR